MTSPQEVLRGDREQHERRPHEEERDPAVDEVLGHLQRARAGAAEARRADLVLGVVAALPGAIR